MWDISIPFQFYYYWRATWNYTDNRACVWMVYVHFRSTTFGKRELMRRRKETMERMEGMSHCAEHVCHWIYTHTHTHSQTSSTLFYFYFIFYSARFDFQTKISLWTLILFVSKCMYASYLINFYLIHTRMIIKTRKKSSINQIEAAGVGATWHTKQQNNKTTFVWFISFWSLPPKSTKNQIHSSSYVVIYILHQIQFGLCLCRCAVHTIGQIEAVKLVERWHWTKRQIKWSRSTNVWISHKHHHIVCYANLTLTHCFNSFFPLQTEIIMMLYHKSNVAMFDVDIMMKLISVQCNQLWILSCFSVSIINIDQHKLN